MSRLFKLDNTTLSIKGNAAGFLNGITSNGLEAPLNAFLNQHGRIIAVVRQEKISDDEFLLSVPKVALDNLYKHWERYVRLSHVTIIPSVINVFINMDTGQIIWSSQDQGSHVSEEEFTLYRLDHQIPLMGIDFKAEEFILNVHEYDYVSYTKGCYLGQEPVAKVHNRAQPSRRLIVGFEDQCSLDEAAKMTSKVFDSQRQKYRGFVFVNNKSQ